MKVEANHWLLHSSRSVWNDRVIPMINSPTPRRAVLGWPLATIGAPNSTVNSNSTRMRVMWTLFKLKVLMLITFSQSNPNYSACLERPQVCFAADPITCLLIRGKSIQLLRYVHIISLKASSRLWTSLPNRTLLALKKGQANWHSPDSPRPPCGPFDPVNIHPSIVESLARSLHFNVERSAGTFVQ